MLVVKRGVYFHIALREWGSKLLRLNAVYLLYSLSAVAQPDPSLPPGYCRREVSGIRLCGDRLRLPSALLAAKG